jgi:hypothetical protein
MIKNSKENKDSILNQRIIIEDAAKIALDVVSKASEEAAKVIANSASEAVKVISAKNLENYDKSSKDHDILIELKTKMEDLKIDIKEIKDGTSAKINNHDERICKLETSKTRQNVMMSIGIAILSLLTTIMIYHLVCSPLK